MCGIAGIISKNRNRIEKSLLFAMAESLSHRGPDEEKFIVFNSQSSSLDLFKRNDNVGIKGDIGFCHRRLSIIDLSDSASQPMTNEKKNLWIVHNGEIFNYIEIREELEKYGYKFNTRSDTEVIIKAYHKWGKHCLHKFNGMWAFVIYDVEKKCIFGARDRFGIKPFYYNDSKEYFSFASEIKALLKLPWISRELFLPVAKDYLLFSRVNTSKYTFFKGIHELEAGHFFEIDLNLGCNLKIYKWWHLPENLSEPPENDIDIFEKFRELLLSSVKLRLISDVPVGSCLSGGLDSTAVVSLVNLYMEKEKQKTFSIVHPGFEYNESKYIDEVVKKFSVTSHKTSLDGKSLLDDLESVINVHDEPFTSTSMYAQWKVFQLAKQCGVTVTLDGQGADEQLAGYPYFKIVYWAELIKRLKILSCIKETFYDSKSALEFISNLMMGFSGFFTHRGMITLAGVKDPQYSLKWINRSYFKKISLPHIPLKKMFNSHLKQRLYEVFTYDGLPALIRYADRNSMAHSLESRMPFLDYRLVSFVFSLPDNLKVRNGLSKYVLREALREDIPQSVLNRTDKIGFITPEDVWFRGELSTWIADILHSGSIEKRGFYNTGKLKGMFEKHKKGTINASRPLWRAVNLELWQRKYID